jgi:hypothetical protein
MTMEAAPEAPVGARRTFIASWPSCAPRASWPVAPWPARRTPPHRARAPRSFGPSCAARRAPGCRWHWRGRSGTTRGRGTTAPCCGLVARLLAHGAGRLGPGRAGDPACRAGERAAPGPDGSPCPGGAGSGRTGRRARAPGPARGRPLGPDVPDALRLLRGPATAILPLPCAPRDAARGSLRVLAVVPTTGGPLLLRRLALRPGFSHPAAFAEGAHRSLALSADYRALAGPEGPVARHLGSSRRTRCASRASPRAGGAGRRR